ncbi:hypothetical protein ACFUMI_37480, partial [Streptomyces sp. NPDC057273]
MKSDRLLSVLLLLPLLQTRGRAPAAELARGHLPRPWGQRGSLEVPVRTVCPDVEALSASGVPVCASARAPE